MDGVSAANAGAIRGRRNAAKPLGALRPPWMAEVPRMQEQFAAYRGLNSLAYTPAPHHDLADSVGEQLQWSSKS
jgi:hypothetical protein